MRVLAIFAFSFALFCSVSDVSATECDSPSPDWLACEDFEGGAEGWDSWFSQSSFTECNGCPDGQPDPARIRLVEGEARTGSWSLHMPGEASANFRGASLTIRTCDGENRPGCPLVGYEQLYYRAWVKLAPDHAYVHHFMSIGGTQPDGYWEGDGNAGCRPNGYRAAGTTVDFNADHELFFYTYFPEMNCDAGGYCSGDYAQGICDGCAQKEMACTDGLECCWGNHFGADPRPVLQKGEWVCLEMMQKLNTPGQADGEMAFWVDGQLGHRELSMAWRDVAELQLNKVWVQHYVADGDTEQPNRIWWDDIVVSTSPIGCSTAAPQNNQAGGDVGTSDDLGTTPGVTPPGVTPPGNGADDAGAIPMGDSVEKGGCACSATGASNPTLLALLGLIGLGRRRR